MLTDRLKTLRARQGKVKRPDFLREIVTAPAKFVARVQRSNIPPHRRAQLLQLARRNEADIVADLTANWYIKHTGKPPSNHDYLPIPDYLLPEVATAAEFERYLDDFRKERSGVTPVKEIRTTYSTKFCLTDPAITEHSTVTVEIAPEIVEIENGRMTFFLQPDGRHRLVVRIANP